MANLAWSVTITPCSQSFGWKVLQLPIDVGCSIFSRTNACADQHLPKRKIPTSLMEGALVMTWTPRGNALLADRRAAPKQEV